MVATAAAANPSSVLLLDTNILIIYARAGKPHERLEAQLGLKTTGVQGMMSVVSHGELLAFAKKRNWGRKRCESLDDLVRTRLIPIHIDAPEIVAAYAEIDLYSEKVAKPARKMGQNDMWIAATASVLGCELVTTDRDFDHLHGVKIHRRWIDPESLR